MGNDGVSNLFFSVDNTTVPQLLMRAVENDDSPVSYARAFHAAVLIPDADLTDLFDQIEDIVAQADETPTTLYVSFLFLHSGVAMLVDLELSHFFLFALLSMMAE